MMIKIVSNMLLVLVNDEIILSTSPASSFFLLFFLGGSLSHALFLPGFEYLKALLLVRGLWVGPFPHQNVV